MRIVCVMKFLNLRWAATGMFLNWVPLSWVYLVEQEVRISNLFSKMLKSDAQPRPVAKYGGLLWRKHRKNARYLCALAFVPVMLEFRSKVRSTDLFKEGN